MLIVSVLFSGMVAIIARARAMIATIPENKTLTINMRESVFSKLANSGRLAETAVNGIETALKGVGDATRTAEGPLSAFGDTAGKASGTLRRLGPLLAGISIVLTTALAPALIALGAAFAGAVAGAGALAAALGTVLVPAALSLVGILGRVSEITKVFALRQAATQAATRATASAAQRAAAAEDSLRNARRSLNDATTSVTRAEEDLNTARANARDDIVDAQKRLTDAQENQSEASRDLGRVTVQAYREIRDAIEDASDAAREFEGTQLDAAQASLNVDKAKQALKDFKAEAGDAGGAVDELFKKFTDVDVDLGGLESAVESMAGGGKASGGLDKSDQLELRQLILNVRKAKQDEAEATDNVSDAERRMNDTTKEATRLKQTGISGVESYHDAVKRLAGTTQDVADAQSDFNELVKLGVQNAPAVIAAQQGLADATLNQKRQQQDLTRAKEKGAEGDQSAITAMELYKEARKKLSKEERTFLDAFIKFSEEWKKRWSEASAPVFTALTAIITAVNGALPQLQGPMNAIGQAWADAIGTVTKTATSPQFLTNMAAGLQAVVPLIQSFAGILSNLMLTFSNIGAAALPALQGIATEIEKMTGGWAKSTSDIEGTRKTLTPMVEVLKDFVSIAANAGGAILDIFKGASGPISEFVGWIKDGIKKFRKWAQSAEGTKKIKKFFEDTLPLAKKLITFVVSLGKMLLLAFQVLAPVIEPFIDGLQAILDVINFFLGLLLKIPTPIRRFIGWILTFLVAFLKIGKIVKGAGDALGKFPTLFDALVAAGKFFIKKLTKPFTDFFGGLAQIFRGLKIRESFRAFRDAIKAIATNAISVLTAPFRLLWRGIRTIFLNGRNAVSGIVDRLKGVFNKIYDFFKPVIEKIQGAWSWLGEGIKTAFNGVKSFIERVFNGVTTTVKNIFNGILFFVNKVIEGINKMTSLANKIPGVPNVPQIPFIPYLAQGGIVQKDTLARIGEAGREAVLPLKDSVYRKLAESIVSAMQPIVRNRTPALAGGSNSFVKNNTIHVDKIVVDAPSGQLPDARATAVSMARELERRGSASF